LSYILDETSRSGNPAATLARQSERLRKQEPGETVLKLAIGKGYSVVVTFAESPLPADVDLAPSGDWAKDFVITVEDYDAEQVRLKFERLTAQDLPRFVHRAEMRAAEILPGRCWRSI